VAQQRGEQRRRVARLEICSEGALVDSAGCSALERDNSSATFRAWWGVK
jgi:hypothetical protein